MLTGVYAARNIVGEKNDVWAVNTEQDYHEEVRSSETEKPSTGYTKTMGDRAVPMPIVQDEADQIIQTAFARMDGVALGVALGVVIGVGLFLATVVLLLRGGEFVGPRLGLLRNFLPGYEVTWGGSLIGLAEGSLLGFGLGFFIASLRNWGMKAYAYLLRRRAETEAAKNVLD